MKIGNNIITILSTILAIVASNENASAQQYKLRQVTGVMNMKSETTIYVKGMRKRTESGGYTGVPGNITTIEQCDLQRTISLNDKKKIYYIEPFSKETETVVYDDEKPSTKNKPIATQASMSTPKGGVVTMFYHINDTGERKNMYGVTARHIWTTQKIKPSADACMKDSMIMKTDGWYIDLPEFNCPVRHTAINTGGMGGVDCKDRYITRQSGKGKLGFPLVEKRVMMGNGLAETSRFETNLETIEFSTAKLDSMLFEIPPGYTLAKDITELQDRFDAAGIAEYYGNNKAEENRQVNSATPKTTGVLRIAVLEPVSNEELNISDLQSYLVTTLQSYNLEAIAVASVEEARRYKCDLVLDSKVAQVKQSNKVGGLLRAVRHVDPYASSTYNIDAQFLLSNLSDGSTRSQKTVSGKFEGTANVALRKAMEEGSLMLLKDLR